MSGVVLVVVGLAGGGACGEGVGSARGTTGSQLLLDHTGTQHSTAMHTEGEEGRQM